MDACLISIIHEKKSSMHSIGAIKHENRGEQSTQSKQIRVWDLQQNQYYQVFQGTK